ncbi:MAG: right-handed parallel beta-helix repeat-containing protein [Planctomycetes bacterium]|nr:right-handed parallel beta-helix repeat-containing protein [Planctomycetota bacterium]
MRMRDLTTGVLAVFLAALALGQTRGDEPRSLDPPVLLPDGQEFKTWEVAPTFSRTYHVAASDARASDENPGTEALPFATIGRAAAVLQPGERVVIQTGVYRERVSPARGGTGPGRMIGYEAAPGAKVVLKGSRILRAKWLPSRHGDEAGPANVWTTKLPQELFGEENPFSLVNLTDEEIDRSMPWAVSRKGKMPNTLRRGLIFQEGKRLRQVAAYEELAATAGSYWVEADGLAVHVHPAGNVDPNQATFEVTVQGFVFAPEAFGLGYIRVKGLVIEHSAGPFPRPQQGALSTQRGHHWIIEENTIRQSNAIGVDIGDQFDLAGPKLAQGGRHIVRGNTITDCGIGGIEGKSIEHTLIERNTIRRCGWHRTWRIYEVAGIKVHCTVSCLVRRNLVTDIIDAPGIWLDYANRNSRVTQNVVVNTECANGGIFMEASQEPNMVDRNFVWGTRGCGIYQHDCDELLIARNFVGQSTQDALRMRICRGREVMGRPTTAKRNRIVANIFVGGGSMLSISDGENTSDHNLLAPGKKPFDLAAWGDAHGWDRNSTVADIQAAFNPETLELTWSARGKIPECPPIDGIPRDFFDRLQEPGPSAPGPFGPLPDEATTVKLDPR